MLGSWREYIVCCKGSRHVSVGMRLHLICCVYHCREDQLPFSIVLYGTDTLVAGALLAFVHSSCPVDRVRFTLLSPSK